MAIVKIKNLALRTIIGFNKEEREKKQDILINVHLDIESSIAEVSDRAEDTVDYKSITKEIISVVEKSDFNLLEALARQIVSLIATHDGIYWTKVEVDKPHALRFSESVSISLEEQFKSRNS